MGYYVRFIMLKHKWATRMKCCEGTSLRQTKTAFSIFILLPNEWLGSLALSIVRLSPKMDIQNPSLPDSGFWRIYIVTPVVPSAQIPVTRPSVELAWSDHSMNLTIPVLSGSDCSDFSCTGSDLREPSVANIWSPLRLLSLRAVRFLHFPPFDC